MTSWTPHSWTRLPALQQPDWPDPDAYSRAVTTLAGLPPLVFADEVADLTADLARVAAGDAFLLQGGDCAETFAASDADTIRAKLQVLLQMAVVLTYGAQLPVVKVGRIAGQFAKPRSRATETVDGVELPSYRGDAVNDVTFDADGRRPDPSRLVRAYHTSASTLNLLRAYTRGGFADLGKVHAWNQEFVAESPRGLQYEQLADDIDRALGFLRACGVDLGDRAFHQVDFYTSHEALLLGYEEALTRVDDTSGATVDGSAHLLWIGERTRDPDGAHVHFLSGVANPVGVKLGPTATATEIDELVGRLNPANLPGRLTLVSRMGKDRVAEVLPDLVRHVRDRGYQVVWACDPMHGNTYTAETGHKTRHFSDILAEVRAFFAIHAEEGTVPGGVHFELTGDDVTECVGGARDLVDADLDARYETACDPRLNQEQALELAFELAAMLRR